MVEEGGVSKMKFRTILVVTTLVLAMACVAGNKVKVPRIESLSLDGARARLAAAGFDDIEVERAVNPEVAAGVVVSSRPEAGESASPDEAIIVTVSSGPDE